MLALGLLDQMHGVADVPQKAGKIGRSLANRHMQQLAELRGHLGGPTLCGDNQVPTGVDGVPCASEPAAADGADGIRNLVFGHELTDAGQTLVKAIHDHCNVPDGGVTALDAGQRAVLDADDQCVWSHRVDNLH